MRAAEIARSLGSAERSGKDWRCRCPLHNGRSLTLADGRNTLLVRCWGGCETNAVLAELRRLGLLEGRSDRIDSRRQEELQRRETAALKAEIERLRRGIERARALYGCGRAAAGTAVQTYLASRGITIPVPPVLRFVRRCLHRNGRYFPAMVAPILDALGRQISAQATFVRSDGLGKAELPKREQREFVGPRMGGAVRLADPRPGVPLLVGEGIESTLSAMQIFGLPGWAALSADGIAALELPSEIRDIRICADNDQNAVGQSAAVTAYRRWTAEDRIARILLPPQAGTDFRDVLVLGHRS